LKSEERAIEKALRSYKGDVSRLVDICRYVGIKYHRTVEKLRF